jgi:hypothetical protein
VFQFGRENAAEAPEECRMKRMSMLVLLGVALVMPAEASANDGGWWDWLWKWDAKFMGGSTEFHLLCLDDQGRRVKYCEEFFTGLGQVFTGKKVTHKFRAVDRTSKALVRLDNVTRIRHEFDLRVGYMKNLGSRYDDADVHGTISTLRLMGAYVNHPVRWLALSGSAGYLRVTGDRFGSHSRAIMAGTAILYPIPKANLVGVRMEVTWIPKGFSAADFGDAGQSSYDKDSVWSAMLSAGFDLRRIGEIR